MTKSTAENAKPGPDEIDHRPLPEPDQVELAMATLFDTTVSLLADSQLEDNLEEMWSCRGVVPVSFEQCLL